MPVEDIIRHITRHDVQALVIMSDAMDRSGVSLAFHEVRDIAGREHAISLAQGILAIRKESLPYMETSDFYEVMDLQDYIKRVILTHLLH
jgi:hypothetical protein